MDNLMDLSMFLTVPFIQTIANNERWTVSTKNKMPIDMYILKEEERIAGAKFTDHNPLVSLHELARLIPNATNTAYNLNQALDNFVVVDVEPKCPANIRDTLLTLPFIYCELSMSGHGYHMIFMTPPTIYTDILASKPAIKEEHGYYEILLNHYVTFTGKQLVPAANAQRADITEFYKVFDTLAAIAKIQKNKELNTEELPDIEDIERGDEIVELLSQAKYEKTLDSFSGDNSKYEFGVAGFYYKKLKMLLDTTKYRNHEYNDLEKMVLLYNIITNIIPYREKHDEIRDGLPLLMYTCKRVVTTIPNK